MSNIHGLHRQLAESYWPILNDVGFAANILAAVLSRLEAAWQEGPSALSAIQALLRVFKLGIRMFRGFKFITEREGIRVPGVEDLETTVNGGVELLFQILTHSHEHRQYTLTKLTIQVLLICSEQRHSVCAILPCWRTPECVECIAAIVAAPIDTATDDAGVVAQWKGKARAILTWMHLCTNLAQDVDPEGEQQEFINSR